MKKYCIYMTVLVLTLTLFTGCGCTSQKATEPMIPTRDTTPTVPATVAPTIPMTEATTEMTMPTVGSSETGAEAETGTATEGAGQNSEPSNAKIRMR